MIRSRNLSEFKLASIDLDGTLLGPAGQISQENRRAVQRLQDAGLEVVLASGRHYISMHRFVDALPGIRWLISCQGGELSTVDRTTVLTTEFLPAATVRETFDLGRSLGFTGVAYAADGVYTDSEWNSHLEFYAELSGTRPSECQSSQIFGRQIFKLIWMGNPGEIDQTARQSPVDPTVIQMVRTNARFLEFMPVAVSKASALKILAERLGVDPAATLAFGDGDNDVPMFEWAGVSVAMAHGWPAALRAATHTSPAGPPDTALARAIDCLFDASHLSAVQTALAATIDGVAART